MPCVFTVLSSTLPAVTLCPSKQLLSGSAGVEALLGRGEPSLVSPWLYWVEFSWGEGSMEMGKDKWNHGGEEEGVQVADTCPGWSQAGHMSCCPSSQESQQSRW